MVNSFSSSDLPDNFFRGQSFEARFKTSIATKQFVYEKLMDISLFKNSSLKNLFKSCGISTMVFPPTKAYPRLVQQFYTNLEHNGDCYTSFVKGKSLFFTVVDFGSIFGIPSTGPCPFTLKGATNIPFPAIEQLRTVMDDNSLSTLFTPKTVDVCPTACVLHKLIRYNLLPRLGGGADFTYQDLVVVAMILKGVTFNYSLMMLSHMISCIRQVKKCLPYGLFLTKMFQHFKIFLDDEIVISHNEFIDSASLKQSHISFVNGLFTRLVPDPTPILPSSVSSERPSDTPSSSSTLPPTNSSNSSSPEILNLLNTIIQNQQSMQSDMTDIKTRLSVLEKGKVSLGSDEVTKVYNRVEDEFIDLQAGFELHTTAMVEALQRKMNRNASQLSHEIKFVSNQVGQLADFSASRMNDVAQKLHFPRKHSSVPEWPQCNWMAEYMGDFLDEPLPDATFIPRPPRFADEYSKEERAQRAKHRPYFTKRAEKNAQIVDLD